MPDIDLLAFDVASAQRIGRVVRYVERLGVGTVERPQRVTQPGRELYPAIAVDAIPRGGRGRVQIYAKGEVSGASDSGGGLFPDGGGSAFIGSVTGNGTESSEGGNGYIPDTFEGIVYATDWLANGRAVNPGDRLFIWWNSPAEEFLLFPPNCCDNGDGSGSGSGSDGTGSNSSETGSSVTSEETGSGSDSSVPSISGPDDSENSGSASASGPSGSGGTGSISASGSPGSAPSGGSSETSNSDRDCACGHVTWHWNGDDWEYPGEDADPPVNPCKHLGCPDHTEIKCGPIKPAGTPADHDGKTTIRTCCAGSCAGHGGGGGH